ncbi:uncharacterized protein [Haliotis cracherodii]|uniref:uncharacterized protein LOC124132287 isoform X1 n=2 Tax=Haliotis rufescens TaxID=6454 RepID=UPI001EAFF909|nr:uncharacterized protein LOC124132287 isoform X1 [Haliotis rufescens]
MVSTNSYRNNQQKVQRSKQESKMGLSFIYSLMVGAAALCLVNTVAGYPMLDAKDKEYSADSESGLSDKESSDQLVAKRIFDPIEAASNFGSFGKRYNPYRVLGYKGQMDAQKAIDGGNIADLLKQVLAVAMVRQGQYKRVPEAQKRQFDPIGYGMFARFG